MTVDEVLAAEVREAAQGWADHHDILIRAEVIDAWTLPERDAYHLARHLLDRGLMPGPPGAWPLLEAAMAEAKGTTPSVPAAPVLPRKDRLRAAAVEAHRLVAGGVKVAAAIEQTGAQYDLAPGQITTLAGYLKSRKPQWLREALTEAGLG